MERRRKEILLLMVIQPKVTQCNLKRMAAASHSCCLSDRNYLCNITGILPCFLFLFFFSSPDLKLAYVEENSRQESANPNLLPVLKMTLVMAAFAGHDRSHMVPKV